MSDGTYQLGAVLPAQGRLAQEFGVSRDTVQRVVRELGRQVMLLGALVSEAFEQAEVTLDVFTLTSESLDTHIRLQTERIRAGAISPESIVVRMLLPDPPVRPAVSGRQA
ncbi:GntR family transcriptional regulator [Streptomyces sp. NPDC093970]|uniref:GntR family transcriptional regulator n=1 Tax=Streptomyces sp. NPDC093970 TaxID=3155076 RepID=UPI003437E881